MKRAKTVFTALVLGTGLVISGCSVSPKTVAETEASGPANPGATNADANTGECSEGCDDGGTNRYQYYLGILSVFLFN